MNIKLNGFSLFIKSAYKNPVTRAELAKLKTVAMRGKYLGEKYRALTPAQRDALMSEVKRTPAVECVMRTQKETKITTKNPYALFVHNNYHRTTGSFEERGRKLSAQWAAEQAEKQAAQPRYTFYE